VSVDPGGNPAGSPQGVPSALRPQLTLGLPIAPEHWQIHYATVIDPMVNFSILEIWARRGDNLLPDFDGAAKKQNSLKTLNLSQLSVDNSK